VPAGGSGGKGFVRKLSSEAIQAYEDDEFEDDDDDEDPAGGEPVAAPAAVDSSTQQHQLKFVPVGGSSANLGEDDYEGNAGVEKTPSGNIKSQYYAIDKALSVLKKGDIKEMTMFKNLPPGIPEVFGACYLLMIWDKVI
jgi:hypothetical protein